eukprot:scaffold746_cov123-Cylindrotheca_fusiformis.AAC.5
MEGDKCESINYQRNFSDVTNANCNILQYKASTKAQIYDVKLLATSSATRTLHASLSTVLNRRLDTFSGFPHLRSLIMLI